MTALPSRQPFASLLLATLAVAAALLMSACEDPTVDVLRPSEQFRFSLFGALDVAADTQSIRVEPLGDSTQIGAPEDLGATVFLENLDTGRQIPLRDSLTDLGVQVHNLWTTRPIQPSTRYQVVVQVEGEPVTTAVTTTPSRPPTLTHTAFPDTSLRLPCVFPVTPNNQRKPANTFTVTARNVDRIAAVEVHYPIPGASRVFNHFDGVERDEDLFIISIFYRDNLVDANPNPPPPPAMQDCASLSDFTRPYAEVIVAAGGPDWPEWRGLPIDELARPDSFSNVQGGNGFVGAVYSDTVQVPVAARP